MNKSHAFQTIRLTQETSWTAIERLSLDDECKSAVNLASEFFFSLCLPLMSPSLHLSCLCSFTWLFLFPVFHSFCYVTPIFLPSICPSFPPARLSLCRPGGLSQSAERGVLPGPGLPGEVPLRRHRGRLLQPQTDPRASAHPRPHHRPVSRLTFYRGIIKKKKKNKLWSQLELQTTTHL